MVSQLKKTNHLHIFKGNYPKKSIQRLNKVQAFYA